MTENAISMEGRLLANVILPKTLSQNVQIGNLGVEAKCAACHSINAAGQDGVAPPLVHKVYGSSHHRDESFQRASGLSGFNQTKAYCHKYPSHSYRTSQQLNGRSSDDLYPSDRYKLLMHLTKTDSQSAVKVQEIDLISNLIST